MAAYAADVAEREAALLRQFTTTAAKAEAALEAIFGQAPEHTWEPAGAATCAKTTIDGLELIARPATETP